MTTGNDTPMDVILVKPFQPMLLGIVCTISANSKDQRGTLRNRITFRVPVSDERDLVSYKAVLTEMGDGVLFTMPATAAYLGDVNNVARICHQLGSDTPTELVYNAFCNKLKKSKMETVTVLLQFPKGTTYNNRSFNQIQGDNDFELQMKFALIFVTTKDPNHPTTAKLCVAFEAALDEDEGLDSSNVTAGATELVADLYRMSMQSAASGLAAGGSNSAPAGSTGGSQGMSTNP